MIILERVFPFFMQSISVHLVMPNNRCYTCASVRLTRVPPFLFYMRPPPRRRRDAFAEVLEKRGREYLFVEVVLIQGVNDSADAARALAALLRPLPTKSSVNLLPLNDTGHPLFRASTRENVEQFRRVLTEEGFVATIRTARWAGDDFGAIMHTRDCCGVTQVAASQQA